MQTNINRSIHAGLVQEIKAIIHGEREVKVMAVGRGSNCVSHELARIAPTCVKTAVWLRSGPEKVVNLCALDHLDPPWLMKALSNRQKNIVVWCSG